jgi:hypothetical protein
MKTEDNLDLPWLVNNSLDRARRLSLDASLTQDAELRLETEFLQHIRQQVKNQPDVTPGDLGWQRLKKQLAQETQQTPARPRWNLGLAVAASLLVIIQGGVIFSLLNQQQVEPAYLPLASNHYQGPVLQVRFNPDIREAQMRNLLLEIDARIIEGPSSNGLYRITLTSEANSRLTQLVDQIRASGLVEHVAQE